MLRAHANLRGASRPGSFVAWYHPIFPRITGCYFWCSFRPFAGWCTPGAGFMVYRFGAMPAFAPDCMTAILWSVVVSRDSKYHTSRSTVTSNGLGPISHGLLRLQCYQPCSTEVIAIGTSDSCAGTLERCLAIGK